MNKEEILNQYKGLTIEKVIENKKHGLNILPRRKKDSILKIFLGEFKDPIMWIMIATCIFSYLVKEYVDVIAILMIILIDVTLGTIQEYKAKEAAASLENMIKVITKVIRNNEIITIDSEEVVVGDICILESGDKISADILLLSASNCTVDESILTGESITVNKEKDDMIYAGCSLITGRALGVVKQVGVNTEIGKIANFVNNSEDEKSPLIIRMEKFSKQISIIILIVSVFLTFILMYKGVPFKDLFLSVVALTVSAMPEGLPLALTLVLTIANNKLIKKNVIVKKLNYVESLGSTTLIATDKTGTLTLNEQTAKSITLVNNKTFNVTGTGYNFEGNIEVNNQDKDVVLEIAFLGGINNEAKLEFIDGKYNYFGDTIDIAFLSLYKKANINKEFHIKNMIPYESQNGYSAVFYQTDKEYVTIKGSLEKVLAYSKYMLKDNKIVPIDKECILKQNEKLASEGYRVIAISYNEHHNKEYVIDNNLIFMGLVSFIDPIRFDTKKSLETCDKAGIKVVMITGDHPKTAYAIGKELNLVNEYDEVATGEDIKKYQKDAKFKEYIKNIKIFARVTPIQKLEIVNAYKELGEYVAVTGDGVNDAPAIKAAHIGISMGSGTDVSKETSDMIISDDSFMSIVSGISEGRNAYNNIRKVIYLLVSCAIAEILFFLLSIVFNMPMPLLPIQLLWINLATDGLQDIALSFEKENDEVMNKKPRNPKETIFNRMLLEEVTLAGFSIGLIVFIVFYILINNYKIDLVLARTYIMTIMVFMQNIHVLNCRSEEKSVFKLSIKDNPFVIFSIISAIIAQILVIELPVLNSFFKTTSIDFNHLLIIFFISLPVLFIMELYKYYKKYNKNN